MAERDVEGIVADLRESGIHIGPGAETWLTDQELQTLQESLGPDGLPVNLVLTVPPERGVSGGDDLMAWVHDGGGPDGLYVGVNNLWEGDAAGEDRHPFLPSEAGSYDQVHVALQQWGAVAGDGDLTDEVDLILSYGDGGQPFGFGEGLITVVEALEDGTFAQLHSEARQALTQRLDEDRSESGTSTAPAPLPGDEDGGLGAGGAVVAVVVVVALGWAIRRRIGSREKRAGAIVLPRSMLEKVREAGDLDLVRRARADVLALGEAIGSSSQPKASGPVWDAALDHYEAASRLLPDHGSERDADPLDTVGAVVLAARGQEALAAARAGRAFKPAKRCFLNPLHGTADRTRTLKQGRHRLRVPVCTGCRNDLDAQRDPDVLDILVRGKPEHYFETDREPWASTGYGAIDPDLLGRLRTSRR